MKCGACAKFLSPIEAAKCTACKALYHRACVLLPPTGSIAPTWYCPECTRNVVRDNKPDTPVRGRIQAAQVESHQSIEPTETGKIMGTPADASTSLLADLADELRLFREEMRTDMRLMRQEIQRFRIDMTEFKESLTASEGRVNDLEARMDVVENRLSQNLMMERNSLEATVAQLKIQLNERDQELLANDIEISGISESKDESTFHLVKILSTKLGVNLDERDVVHIERLGSPRRNRVAALDSDVSDNQRPRNIYVRFARRSTRDTLLRAARVRRGLTTADLPIDTPTRRVYVNERLTRINRQLFYKARQAGTINKWKYIWTKEGRIFARKETDNKVEQIKCEEDIDKIFGRI